MWIKTNRVGKYHYDDGNWIKAGRLACGREAKHALFTMSDEDFKAHNRVICCATCLRIKTKKEKPRRVVNCYYTQAASPNEQD